MKRKILAMGLFGLCALAFFTGEAKAFFGMFSPHSPWHRHNRYVTQITCRPYNAFTPICWGNLVCDGACPSPCGVASGQMPLMMGAPPWACPGSECCPGYGGCGPEGAMASDMAMMPPPMHGMPTHGAPIHGPMYGAPMPGPYGPPMPAPGSAPAPSPFIGPPPMPLPPGPGMTMYPYGGVAQANYYPMPQPYYPNYAMPTYNPYMGWPMAQPAPYYWYGGR